MCFGLTPLLKFLVGDVRCLFFTLRVDSEQILRERCLYISQTLCGLERKMPVLGIPDGDESLVDSSLG